MDALIRVRPDELKQDLLDKLKALVGSDPSTEIIIQVKESSSEGTLAGDPAAYRKSLNDSIQDKAEGRTTVFSMEELRRYVEDNFSQ